MSGENKVEGKRDGLGRTLLHLAAEKSDVGKLEELLCSGDCDVNAQDAQGRTPLHSLFEEDIIKDMDKLKRAMSVLLKYGANVNIKDKFQDTPLHVVFYSYYEFIPEILRFLLTKSKVKFDVKSQNIVGYTIFYKCMCGFPDSLRERDIYPNIIQQMESFINDFMNEKICQPCPVKDLLNMKDKFGFSAFYMYTMNVDNNIETIKRMIQLGADVNTRSNIGVTPLMDVVLNRVTPIVEVLLQSGADVNNKDIFGQTALFRVLTKDCFDLLEQYGADFTIRDKFGQSPITDVFMYTPEDTPRSGLVISDVATNYQPLFELFLKNGVSVHEMDNFSSSLLHYAAWYGAPIMASALIEHGLPLTVLDNQGISPAKLARRVGNYELVNMLTGTTREVDKDPVKRHYVNLLIYHEDVANIDKALHEVLSFQENPRELLQNLINSPRLGLVNRESEAQEVKDEILKLMYKIAESISKNDPAFRCTVFPTGSSEDGSKIGEADEFDFTFCLDFFSGECIPYQEDDTLNSGFATLKVKSFHEWHPLAKYTTDGYIIESYLVRDMFQDLFTKAVNTPEIWNQNCFYFDGLLKFPVDKPILNMEVHWCGRIMKNIVISIDVVPAVRTWGWMPKELENIDRELPSQQLSSEDECFLLFQPPEERDKQRRRYLRISRFCSELKFLKNLPEAFLESYAAAKILICDRFCPRLLFSEDLNIKQIFCKQTSEMNSSVEDEEMNSEEDEHIIDAGVLQKQTMGSESDEHSINSDSDDAETSSDIIEGTILYKHGAVRDLSSCIIEVDQTLRANRLFVPKDSFKLDVSNLSFSLQNGALQAKKCIVVRSIQKDTSKWIQFGPSSNIPKKETLDAVIMDSLSREENQNLTIAEWLTQTFPSVSHSSENDMEENIEIEENRDIDQKLMEDGREGNTNQNTSHITSDERNSSNTVPRCDTDILDKSWEGGEIVDGYDTISSYMLKNCLFYVAVDLKGDKDVSQLDITIKLFEKLGKCAEEEKLDSFFLPYLDVFTFANEHIKMIPDDKIIESTKIQCNRIKLFCDVILGILR
ncbi:uncharacterized protein LOC133181155 [Saccostrea echinata]|uniref:uncharacterized protein LOC133181155 n=1 Tax=Saccostrea echinata TaxID=191078 RepID=UPI002A80805A|nr:uncharacterized protein LOC133181155 [Saccostrea echinata]